MSPSISRRSLVKGAVAAGAANSFPLRLARAQEPRTKIRMGMVRLISSGPMFIAEARKFADRVNLEIEIQYFADGALAIPALVAGEIDVAASTLNAGLFNTVSKGAPFKLILDRGIERPGYGSMTIVASNAMVETGYHVGKGAMLKGKRIAIQAPGSIDQYLLGREAQKAGLDPRTDLNWSSGMPYPDMVRLMGAGQTDVANIPVPLAFLVENNKFGKIVGTGADIEPNTQLGCFVMSSRFLEANRSAAVRFCMLHTYAASLFTRGAAEKDPEIIKIISDATKVPERLIAAAAPRWTWYDENGMPNLASADAQFNFFSQSMRLVSGRVTREMLFDLGPANEAAERLKAKNPFL